jgi:cytohesin
MKHEVFSAIKNNDLDKVKRLIENDPSIDINATFDDEINDETEIGRNKSLFFTACSYGYLEIVKYLYSLNGLDPNKQDQNLRSPFYEACKQSHFPIVEFLIRKRNININTINRYGYTALIASKDPNIIKLILEDKRIDPNAQTHLNGNARITALIFTIQYNNTNAESIFNFLLNDPRVNPNIQDLKCNTALHYAVLDNKINCVRLLLNDPRTDPNIQNYDGSTPLHLAISKGYIECTELLLKKNNKTNPNIKNFIGQTPLIKLSMPAQVNLIPCAKLLLEHPLTDPNIVNESGYSALHNSNKVLFLIELLNHPQTNHNLQNKKGETPFFSACSRINSKNNLDAIKIMLSHPKINPNISNHDGVSPLFHRMFGAKVNLEIVKILLNKSTSIDVNFQNTESKTCALSLLMEKNGEENLKFIELLLEHPGLDINSQNIEGMTPLHFAVKAQNEAYCRILLSKPLTNPNIQDHKNKSSLVYAIDAGLHQII